MKLRLTGTEAYNVLLRHAAELQGFDPDTDDLEGDVSIEIDQRKREIDWVDLEVRVKQPAAAKGHSRAPRARRG